MLSKRSAKSYLCFLPKVSHEKREGGLIYLYLCVLYSETALVGHIVWPAGQQKP